MLLTRDAVLPRLTNVTTVPITTRLRAIPTQVALDQACGLSRLSAASCDNVTTVPKSLLVRRRGQVDVVRMRAIALAIKVALDLD